MKKEAFLQALERRLEGMSADEKARALEFCAESIDDRVEDGMAEEDAVAALGNVEDVARGLLADRPLGAVVREMCIRDSPRLVRRRARLRAVSRAWRAHCGRICFYGH